MNAFKITGRMLTFSRITLESNDLDIIREQLQEISKKNPILGVPVVIDSTVEQELIEVIQLFVSLGLQPMAVIEGILAEQAKAIQIPVLPKDRAVQRIQATDEQSAVFKTPTPPTPVATTEDKNKAETKKDSDENTVKPDNKDNETTAQDDDNTTKTEQENNTASTDDTKNTDSENTNVENTDETTENAENTEDQETETTEPIPAPEPIIITIEHKTSFHNMMLRTGQSLVQENGDVVLMASMNSGAEIIASGNVHVYGSARGRIIAGATGDIRARIFCQYLDADLVSIAGTYCLAEDIPPYAVGRPTYIYLNEEHELVFEPLKDV